MQDKENKNIVDSQGNVLKSKKNNKLKQFLETNIWNILGPGLATCITLVGIVNLMISKKFSFSCANFYGIDRRYFSGTEMVEDKVIFFLCAVALFAYPFVLSYVNKKINSKINVIVTVPLAIFILFVQNILYAVELINKIPWNWLKACIDNYVVISIFLASDVLIVYFVIIRNFFFRKKKFKIIEKVIFVIALLVYVLNVLIGFTIKISYDISDKKEYEIIENNRAIISSYDGKFVVMDCEIQDETIILKKGVYSLEEMTGISITYHKYEEVICE